MDKSIKDFFELLENEILFICFKWQIYTQLFGSSEENIELLNDFAPICFGIYQNALFDDVILSICRVADRSGEKGNTNLSLSKLCDLIGDSDNEQLKKIQELCAGLQKQRNKRIGHNDYRSSMLNSN